MKRLLGAAGLGLAWLAGVASAQVIEVQSNGISYQTLTKSGITVMFNHLPGNLHQYAIVQVAISNGSQGPYIIRPEDFTFERTDGVKIRAVPARVVIDMLRQKANGSDAIKLVTTYENAIYGSPHPQALKGWESRREAAIASTGNKVTTSLIASALALVQTKLAVGDTTDGAIFFPTEGKPLGTGRLVVRTNTDVFEFNNESN
ncbi:MAG TPA: hypothetical protein VMB03_26000 [Bryobacteraceae bacterium]|nr:hypothetical protein [Bryobacteraceae bacterium]